MSVQRFSSARALKPSRVRASDEGGVAPFRALRLQPRVRYLDDGGCSCPLVAAPPRGCDGDAPRASADGSFPPSYAAARRIPQMVFADSMPSRLCGAACSARASLVFCDPAAHACDNAEAAERVTAARSAYDGPRGMGLRATRSLLPRVHLATYTGRVVVSRARLTAQDLRNVVALPAPATVGARARAGGGPSSISSSSSARARDGSPPSGRCASVSAAAPPDAAAAVARRARAGRPASASTAHGRLRLAAPAPPAAAAVALAPSAPRHYLVGAASSSRARLVNHSCAPNCELQRWARADSAGGGAVLRLVTARRIKRGERLTIDYGWPAEAWAGAGGCMCGARGCNLKFPPPPPPPPPTASLPAAAVGVSSTKATGTM